VEQQCKEEDKATTRRRHNIKILKMEQQCKEKNRATKEGIKL